MGGWDGNVYKEYVMSKVYNGGLTLFTFIMFCFELVLIRPMEATMQREIMKVLLHCGYKRTAGSLTTQRKLFILMYDYTKCWGIHPSG